jgi:hypothetical protein
LNLFEELSSLFDIYKWALRRWLEQMI